MTPEQLQAIRERNEARERPCDENELRCIVDDMGRCISHDEQDSGAIEDIDALLAEVERLQDAALRRRPGNLPCMSIYCDYDYGHPGPCGAKEPK